MNEFQIKFEIYGGDYPATMGRFMGNEAMYLRLLDMLFRDESLRQLGAALETGDIKSAFEAAHTLKGAVGNMGLTPLYQAVCAIVEPLRAGEPRGGLSGAVCGNSNGVSTGRSASRAVERRQRK